MSWWSSLWERSGSVDWDDWGCSIGMMMKLATYSLHVKFGRSAVCPACLDLLRNPRTKGIRPYTKFSDLWYKTQTFSGPPFGTLWQHWWWWLLIRTNLERSKTRCWRRSASWPTAFSEECFTLRISSDVKAEFWTRYQQCNSNSLLWSAFHTESWPIAMLKLNIGSMQTQQNKRPLRADQQSSVKPH